MKTTSFLSRIFCEKFDSKFFEEFVTEKDRGRSGIATNKLLKASEPINLSRFRRSALQNRFYYVQQFCFRLVNR